MKIKASFLLQLLLLVSFITYNEAGAWLWPRVGIAATSPNTLRDIPTPIEVAEESIDASEDSEYAMSTENQAISGQIDSMDATGEETLKMNQDQLKNLQLSDPAGSNVITGEPSSEYEDNWFDKFNRDQDERARQEKLAHIIPRAVACFVSLVLSILGCRWCKACRCSGSSYQALNDERANEENERNRPAPEV